MKGQWTQEKANDLAAEILIDLMEKEEGVKEFMALRKIVFETVEDGKKGNARQVEQVDVDADLNRI